MKKLSIILLMACLLLGTFSKTVYAEEVGQEQTDEEKKDEEKKEEIKSPYLEIVPETNLIKNWSEGPLIHSEGACVIDMETGTVLYGKNLHKKLYPASTTKVMTTLVALENSQLEDKVTFSKNAIESNPWDGTNAGIVEGEVLSMKDALYAVMLVSANEACSGVGEHISGSVDAFVEKMNEKARELGCENTHFVTPNGLHHPNHYTTPYDLALISRAAYENPDFREIVGSRHYEIDKTNKSEEKKQLYNTHKILMDTDYHRDECVGGKTGFTDEALNTLVTFAKKDGRALAVVTMHGNGAIWAVEDTLKLMDYGFELFKKAPITYEDIQLKVAPLRKSLEEDVAHPYPYAFGSRPWKLSIPFQSYLVLPKTLDVKNMDANWTFMSGSRQLWRGDYQYLGQPMGHSYVKLSPPNYRKYYSGIQLVSWQTAEFFEREKEDTIYYGSILVASFVVFLISFFFSILQMLRSFKVRRKKEHKRKEVQEDI